MHTPTQLQKIIEDAIPQVKYPSKPSNLYTPIQYIMNLGGKRIRPVMVLMAAELFTEDITKAIDVALAIETFHNFTLVHDDIMDNAPLRRGKQTVHEKWGVNNAILSGDVMMVESNKHLSKVDISVLRPVLETFNQTAQGVCEGQQLDMEFEVRDNVSITEYIDMIRLKTAVLLGGAMKLGGIVGGANTENAELLYQFGENLGVAFQLQDDILDVYGDPEKFGKQVGGDIIANKKTLLLLSALKLANEGQLQQLQHWMEVANINSEVKIDAVRKIFDELKVRELAEKEMDRYATIAFEALDQIAVPKEKKDHLFDLAGQILKRNS
jgi:geranylgeranyl diphosphate synthase, type II